MSLLCRPLKSAGRSPPRTTIVRDVGDAVRTQRSGGQPEYEPIRAACNRLAQLSTCTYLLQRRCDSGERDVCAAPRHSLREALYCVCVSLVISRTGNRMLTHAQSGVVYESGIRIRSRIRKWYKNPELYTKVVYAYSALDDGGL